MAEEEVRSAACSLPGLPRVINLEPTTWAGVLQSIAQVGVATGCQAEAARTVAALEERVAAVDDRSALLTPRPRVVLLEWIDPPFCCGHWSPELVAFAGGDECLGRVGIPSRTLSWDELAAAKPEVMVIACCGFDVARTRQDLHLLTAAPGWSALPCVKTGQIYLVNGSAYFSRPGPRLVDSLEILAHLLHPEIHPLPPGLPPAEPAFGRKQASTLC